MVVYEREEPCKNCGCKLAVQIKQIETTGKGDEIRKVYIKCIRCNLQTLKQKTKTYSAGGAIHQVHINKEELEREKLKPLEPLVVNGD